MEIDFRFLSNKEIDLTIEKAKKICDTVYVKGTTTEATFNTSMPAFETTEKTIALFEYAKGVSRQNDFDVTGSVVLGGGSDAAQYVKFDVPVLCSCGVQGEFNHTNREYADVESLFRRTVLVSMLIYNVADFEESL